MRRYALAMDIDLDAFALAIGRQVVRSLMLETQVASLQAALGAAQDDAKRTRLALAAAAGPEPNGEHEDQPVPRPARAPRSA